MKKIGLLVIALIVLPVAQSGAQNLAASIDGDGDYIDFAAIGIAPDSSVTYEAWFYPTSMPGGGYPTTTWFFDRPSVGNNIISLSASFQHPVPMWNLLTRYDDFSGHTDTVGTPVELNTWTHVAVVRDYGSQLRIYINGDLKGTNPDQPKNLTPPQLRIGGHSYIGACAWAGRVDRFRVWKTARTVTEIVSTADVEIDAASAGLHSNLVASWNFQGSATDDAGSNDGVLLGHTSFAPADDIPLLDCNGNGVPDALDIASGTSKDANGNQVPDECECFGVAYPYGLGCPGDGGIVPVLNVTGCPSPGSTIILEIDSAKPQSLAVMLLGVFESAIPAAGSCTLNVSPVLPLVFTLPLGGTPGIPGSGGIAVPIPLSPGAPSGTVKLQAFVGDNTHPWGYSATSAFSVTVP